MQFPSTSAAAFADITSARHTNTPPWEAWFFVCFLVTSSALPFLLGDQQQSLLSPEEMGIFSAAQGSREKQTILAVFYGIFVILLFLRDAWRRVVSLAWPLALLLCLCFLSILWSDMPAVTARRTAALGGTLLAGCYIGLRCRQSELLDILFRAVAVVMLASLVLALLVPPMGLDPEGRLRGVFAHKNSAGTFAAFGLLVASLRLTSRGLKANAASLAVVAACLVTLLLSRSAAPAAIILLPLLIAFCQGQARTVVFLLVVIAGVLVGMLLPVIAPAVGRLAIYLGRDADFSGRTAVWEFALEYLSRKPWLGFGFGTFWNGPAGIIFAQWTRYPVPHAHNGFLQLALDVGMVGVVVMFFAIAAAVRATVALCATDTATARWAMSFIAFYLLSNLAEASLWEPNGFLTFLFAATFVRVFISVPVGGLLHPTVRRQASRSVHRTPP
jgi:O-antigen ligase